MSEYGKPLPKEWFFEHLGNDESLPLEDREPQRIALARAFAAADRELDTAIRARRACVHWYSDESARYAAAACPVYAAMLEIYGVTTASVSGIIDVDTTVRRIVEAELAHCCLEELRAANKGDCA